jgi:alkylation response protein AidB-like acyl-CoA dehydrogenase
MRHDRRGPCGDLRGLSQALARESAAHDADGGFPSAAFAELARRGLVAAPPVGPAEMGKLLRTLAAVGRGDLSVGRIFEGHVNALTLIDGHGTPHQRRTLRRIAEKGGLFGVWNTDDPADPLRIEGDRLDGRKTFASGVDGLAQAIVTVDEPAGRQMLVVPVAGLGVDRGWWRPLGMRASGSHVADFSGLRCDPDWRLGAPDDYLAQPWFSAGAIRFLAVHVGGMHAVLDLATAHLGRTGRSDNPHQALRLARMAGSVETGYLWLERLAGLWTAASRDGAAAERRLLAAANGARLVVEAAALAVLEEAERAIGAAGFIAPHPFERLMRDLRTYLRQPNPDGAATAFGAAVAGGDWTPLGDDDLPR